ncbi:PREDICTED: putative serine/threonine-protein kinase-like protein CCR3 [Ipomoea nil]|uniref:putative serine/threonine-protein kinase-like protein CCR3 n=1 Tax=Ipomoea nil TaxID=35883 RepID=UPI000901250B|nr:PREDICTED: putative serine/threonine-protein kinase-like protein CCR3 [Ipomoea nil]
MKIKKRSNLYPTVLINLFVVLISLPRPAIGYGAASTIAVSYAANSTAVVCGISAGEVKQGIQCYKNGQIFRVEPYISYESISGGLGFFCGLNSGGSVLLCWETNAFLAKRLYYSREKRLRGLTVGNSHVCAIEEPTGLASCWRFKKSGVEQKFETITSGGGFSCGIVKSNGSVLCWGTSGIAGELQRQFGNAKMESLAAGEFHACGMAKNGSLVCKGRNGGDVPFRSAFVFADLALGANHSCGILRNNGSVLCWGGGSERLRFLDSAVKNVSFESIVSGLDFACGLTTKNLSVICWGPGWPKGNVVPLPTIIPGPCTQASTCSCGIYPNSDTICAGSGNICKSCDVLELPFPTLLPPLPHSAPKPRLHPVSSSSKAQIRRFWGFVIFGSLGAFAGLCALAYCTWRGFSSTMESSRQAGGTVENASSSMNESSGLKHVEIAEKMRFSVSELAAATGNFAMENKIGSGSFGTVYKGRLGNGCEVAIKRGEIVSRKKKFREKENAFRSEIMLLSRLHHRHLVELVGFCHEDEERLLVYEFMSNGSLYDHLHNKANLEKGSEKLNSWKTRIKLALDAARGIEYLHNYAVPPIIHRDIKSSNILLDENMTAKVSDFGLSLITADSEDSMSSGKAVGTVGYIDPEYYVLNILTSKSDVYGLGVVLLELLSGKKAVFRDEESGPTGIVEHLRPMISAGEISTILDQRVGLPKENEVESVELLAYTAMHCVSLEGRDRPSISDIVANLEKALFLCQ